MNVKVSKVKLWPCNSSPTYISFTDYAGNSLRLNNAPESDTRVPDLMGQILWSLKKLIQNRFKILPPLFIFLGSFNKLNKAIKVKRLIVQNGFKQHVKTPNNFPLGLLVLVLARSQLLQKRSDSTAHAVAYYGLFMPTATLIHILIGVQEVLGRFVVYCGT